MVSAAHVLHVTVSSGSWLIPTLGLVIAAVTFVVAVSQALLLRQQGRRAEVTLTNEILNAWEQVRPSWRVVVAASMADDFYAPLVSSEDRARITRIGKRPRRAKRMFTDDQLWLSDHARFTLTTLGRLADLVLSGRVGVPLAYSVFGRELVRYSAQLRAALTSETAIWAHVDTLTPQVGTRQSIFALVDLMWSEAVRRHDLSRYTVQQAAALKVASSGKYSRHRVRVLAHRAGSSKLLARRLVKLLGDSERPPPDDGVHDPEPVPGG